jgi:branched-chain amino acid transport system ATP-binding protein
MGNPDLVLVDEPTEGLSPQMVERIAKLLLEIAARQISILLVEQRLTIALRISHRVYVLGHGTVVFRGVPDELKQSTDIQHQWLSV